MKAAGLIILLFLSIGLQAQNESVEHWRELGYEAKQEGDIESSIKNYKKVLEIDRDDYDAKLALANLYYSQQKFEESLSYYNMIYQSDNSDVEALNGFGRCYLKLGDLDKSTFYFQKAIEYLPSYIQQYFDLAHVFVDKGELDSARIVYSEVLQIDSTYAEAWAGIGKMYYWQNSPKTALHHYEKAILLDPENKETQKEYLQVSNELDYSPYATFSYINETEDTYEINAFTQKYGLNKRISDHFAISVNFLLDKSDRNYFNDLADTTRWYDNTWVKASWITKNNTVSLYTGASVSDSRFTSYGLNWISSFKISDIKFKNNLTFGYDYFYYWNEVGKDLVSNSFSATYKKFSLNASGMYGVIREDTISDYYADKYERAVNPHRGYGISLKYQLFKVPKVYVSVGHSYLDFDYKSPLYYTPYERTLNGVSVSVFYKIKDFYLYSDFEYNLSREVYYEEVETGQGQGAQQGSKFEKHYLYDNTTWNGSFEFGYDFGKLSVSIGGYHFQNLYYQSSNAFISIKGKF
ncbi:tetratricopeptide repeat protein [Desulfosarcina sp.]|nr:tetratricopeptide repeat protein [Desulfosarcina sp.]